MKSFNKFILGFAFTILTISLFAQKSQITLLDKDTYLPIQGATFQYGDETGISNENGLISFTYSDALIMKLSHINYGNWELNSTELTNLIREKVYYRQSVDVELYPVYGFSRSSKTNSFR